MNQLKQPRAVAELSSNVSDRVENDSSILVVELDTGECELTGHSFARIPAGDYEATYSHFETAPVFSKRIKGDKETLQGGKIYLHFNIDPFRNSDALDPKENINLFISYNAASVTAPFGKNGKFRMTRGKYFVKDFERLIGSVKRRGRISPNIYKGMLLKVHVRDVTNRSNKKDKYSKDCYYSVIDQLKEIVTG